MTCIQMHFVSGKKKFVALSMLVLVMLFALSMATYIADRYAVIAESLLDDPATVEKDLIDISDQSIPVYNEALRALNMARIFAPMNSDYARAHADLNVRLRVWMDSMQDMGLPFQGDLSLSGRLNDESLHLSKLAVLMDPSNADHLITLGQIYADSGDLDAAFVSWMRAVDSYPINGSIRYSAAMQMMMNGLSRQAQEQARILAMNDDSYRLNDDDTATGHIRERRPPNYESQLMVSFLYKAMEITWITSANNPNAVLKIVPDNVDAREVARLFFEEKRVDFGVLNEIGSVKSRGKQLIQQLE